MRFVRREADVSSLVCDQEVKLVIIARSVKRETLAKRTLDGEPLGDRLSFGDTARWQSIRTVATSSASSAASFTLSSISLATMIASKTPRSTFLAAMRKVTAEAMEADISNRG